MYALIDCNNFYVSCERIFDLSLENKPVAILSNNDGCVISRSNELKALNVKMGTPFFQLKPLIKKHGIECRSSNYELYGDISQRVMNVLNQFTPEVEPYSIDEAFVRIKLPKNQNYFEYGMKIHQTILQWVGVPVGVGFAPTKTLAKIANHIAKKSADGVFVMPQNPMQTLNDLPVEDVWGIGRRIAKRLHAIGIYKAGNFASQEQSFLKKKFNVMVARTALELNGINAVPVEDVTALPQSISCSRSFGSPVFELKYLQEAVSDYASKAAVKLRESKQLAAGAQVYIQYYPEYTPIYREGGFRGATVRFEQPTAATGVILNSLLNALPKLFIKGRRYKKAGVVFFELSSTENVQEQLFSFNTNSNSVENPENEKQTELYKTLDEINKKFGSNTIFNLSSGIEKPWKMKRDHLSKLYTTNWNQLMTVK